MTVEVAAVIVRAELDEKTWNISAKVIDTLFDRPKIPIENEGWLSGARLIGTDIKLTYDGPIMPRFVIRAGILFRLELSQEDIEKALEQIANNITPKIHIEPEVIRPMSEPCVRVPLSILSELRGQEVGIEYSRRALVNACAERKPLTVKVTTEE